MYPLEHSGSLCNNLHEVSANILYFPPKNNCALEQDIYVRARDLLQIEVLAIQLSTLVYTKGDTLGIWNEDVDISRLYHCAENQCCAILL